MSNINEFFGGSSLPRLAVDLTFTEGVHLKKSVSVADASAGLTTVLSLTGKFAVYYMFLSGLPTSEDITIKLTVDGVVVWNGVSNSASGDRALINDDGNTVVSSFLEEGCMCNSSLLLEVQTTSADLFTLDYMARPIL